MSPPAAISHALLIGIAFWFTVPARAEPSARPPRLDLAQDSAEQPPGLAGSRTTVLVPLPAEPGWQDMAFLAAIPAATVINRGAPSLVALEAAGTLTPEIQDYLRRYRPDAVFLLGNAADDLVIAGRTCGVLKAGDADEAACVLSNRFWRTLGTENGAGNADLRLTWPTADQLSSDLRGDYDALGALPEYLCLVGFPDGVPQAIFGKGASGTEQTSDLPYANADDDPFAEICVACVIAENASFATLYASRALTYHSLLDPEWQDRACQACWENTAGERFENVGFDATYRHTKENLKWLVPPAQGQPGEQAQTFDQDSPLAHCAALTHENHSWWHELGETFDWNTGVLLAPVVVESGGCLTAALDREPDFHSVVARLLRNGAVSFSGNTREGIAECELQRQEFWNGVLSGQTVGRAHRLSMNSAQVTILDKQEGAGGGYQYQLRIRTLFGDPGLLMHLPGRPRSAPARCVVSNDTLTVHAPQEWWPVKMHVRADWKKWADKDLYVLRGAGTYARRSWSGEQYDKEEIYLTAEFTTRRRVAKIEQVQEPPAPLGWNGSYYADEHADGSRTYRWSVRLADFDQVQGTMVNAVERLEYRITYQ